MSSQQWLVPHSCTLCVSKPVQGALGSSAALAFGASTQSSTVHCHCAEAAIPTAGLPAQGSALCSLACPRHRHVCAACRRHECWKTIVASGSASTRILVPLVSRALLKLGQHMCGAESHVCAATRVALHQPRLHGICPPLRVLRRRWCESWMASKNASSGASGRSVPSGGWRACRATPRCAASGAFSGCCCASAAGWALECWDSAAFASVRCS